MAFDFDPAERQQFDRALVAHLLEAFPGTSAAWNLHDRYLVLIFPGDRRCAVYEPNFFFLRGSYADAELFAMAARAIDAGCAAWREVAA